MTGSKASTPGSRWTALVIGIALSATFAACGGGDDNRTQADGGSAGARTPVGSQSRCGTIPAKLAADPDGVLAELPKDLQEGYRGYQAVHASKWADWRPKGKPPYTVGVSVPNSDTPFTQVFVKTVQSEAAKSDVVGDVRVSVARNDLQAQIQQLQGLIRDRVDILVVLPLSSEALAPLYHVAANAGIPVVSALSPSPSPEAVGVLSSLYLNGALTASQLVKISGEKGRVLMVRGIPSSPGDQLVQQGARDVFKLCPAIEPVGNLVGQYAPPVAKAETLKYLAANLQPIAGVIQSGTMAGGVIQAFEQAGRKPPVVAAISADPGSLAWWNEHKDDYQGVGTGNGGVQLTQGIWGVTVRMLAGGGVRMTDIVQAPPLITNSNLSEWVQPGWTPRTVGFAEGPKGSLFSESFLDAFFEQPAGGS